MAWLDSTFLWTFEHSSMSLWILFVPISMWITLGLPTTLVWATLCEENDEGWKKSLLIVMGYVVTPIVYWIVVGYIGSVLYK